LANEIILLADQNKSKELKTFAEKLINDSDNFNIDEIGRMLDEITQLL